MCGAAPVGGCRGIRDGISAGTTAVLVCNLSLGDEERCSHSTNKTTFDLDTLKSDELGFENLQSASRGQQLSEQKSNSSSNLWCFRRVWRWPTGARELARGCLCPPSSAPDASARESRGPQGPHRPPQALTDPSRWRVNEFFTLRVCRTCSSNWLLVRLNSVPMRLQDPADTLLSDL